MVVTSYCPNNVLVAVAAPSVTPRAPVKMVLLEPAPVARALRRLSASPETSLVPISGARGASGIAAGGGGAEGEPPHMGILQLTFTITGMIAHAVPMSKGIRLSPYCLVGCNHLHSCCVHRGCDLNGHEVSHALVLVQQRSDTVHPSNRS